ncbi:MAG: hypothetical protein ACKOJF_04675 [Planctomycetaceae bacterium]
MSGGTGGVALLGAWGCARRRRPPGFDGSAALAGAGWSGFD